MNKVFSYIILVLKNICPPFIWKIKNIFTIQKYYGLDNLDQKVQKYLNYNNGFFIEIGANDGIEQSNTFFLEKEKNWKGILIEPILHKYLDCKKNRSNKNKFFCCACVSNNYKKNYVELLYSNLMTVPIKLESDLKNKIKHANLSNIIRKKRGEKKIEVINFFSKARTLTSILNEAKAPKNIDFFSLDVEGAEVEVLKGIDFKIYKFKYLLIETRNLGKLKKFLNKKKYILKDKLSHHDYIFELKTRNY